MAQLCVNALILQTPYCIRNYDWQSWGLVGQFRPIVKTILHRCKVLMEIHVTLYKEMLKLHHKEKILANFVMFIIEGGFFIDLCSKMLPYTLI